MLRHLTEAAAVCLGGGGVVVRPDAYEGWKHRGGGWNKREQNIVTFNHQ